MSTLCAETGPHRKEPGGEMADSRAGAGRTGVELEHLEVLVPENREVLRE